MRRTVVVHDWMPVYGGAERVADEIAELLQARALFASCVDPQASRELRYRGPVVDVTPPVLRRLFERSRVFLPLLAARYERLDLADFDLVVSSSYAVAKGVRARPDQLHIAYVHSPMRYAWDLEWTYLGDVRGGVLARALAARWVRRLREWDFRTAAGIDHIVANSTFVARRIWRAWRRRATVIHPPVDIAEMPVRTGRGEHFLTVCRLVPYKRVDVLVEAFRLLPGQRLVVVGGGPLLARLRRTAPPNVRFEGHVPRARLLRLLGSAKAFLYAAEEDFGVAMVEAQAAGVPVIAYGRGGAADIVRPLGRDRHPTGILLGERTPRIFAEAVRQFDALAPLLSPDACRENALRFDRGVFRRRFGTFVEERWERHVEALRRGRLPWEEPEDGEPPAPARIGAAS